MKRFISIVAVLSVLLISISSFASSDGGIVLKNWYDRAIGPAAEEAAAEFASEMIGLDITVDEENSKQLAEAEKELDLLSLLISENSSKEVINYQKRYIQKANATEETLRKKDFSALKSEETLNLESELENDAAEILADVLQ